MFFEIIDFLFLTRLAGVKNKENIIPLIYERHLPLSGGDVSKPAMAEFGFGALRICHNLLIHRARRRPTTYNLYEGRGETHKIWLAANRPGAPSFCPLS